MSQQPDRRSAPSLAPAHTQAKDRFEILAYSSQGDTEPVGIEEFEPVH